MRQVLLIIDVQPTFNPPDWLVNGINALLGQLPSVATVEHHDENHTPFIRQLGWQPAADDHSLVAADRVFIKHGYFQTLSMAASPCPASTKCKGTISGMRPTHYWATTSLSSRMKARMCG